MQVAAMPASRPALDLRSSVSGLTLQRYTAERDAADLWLMRRGWEPLLRLIRLGAEVVNEALISYLQWLYNTGAVRSRATYVLAVI